MKTHLLFIFIGLFSLSVSFKSEAQYQQWTQMTSPPINGTSLAINKSNDYFFMGTYQNGLYRSVNKGQSWQKVLGTATENGFYAVEVRADGVVFAGGLGAVYRSSDQGTTWTKLPVGTSAAITQLTFSSTGTVFAGTQAMLEAPVDLWPGTTSGDGVFTSADNGATWTALNTGLENTSKSIGALLMVHPNTLYAGVHDENQTFAGGVYRLESNNVWQKKHLLVNYGTYTEHVYPYKIHDLATDGFGGIYVSSDGVYGEPGSSNKVAGSFLSKTTDGGATWQASHVLPFPGSSTSEPVPTSLFQTDNSAWVSTLIGHIPGDRANISGLYENPNGQGWTRENSLFSNFDLHFAEDSEGIVYALEDFQTKLYKSSNLTSSPEEIALATATVFPNPAVEKVTFAFALTAAADVQIQMFNLQGQKVSQLQNGKLSPGNHQFTWQTRQGQAGTYVAKITVNGKASTRKVVVLP